ncbi:MAG: 2-hydroxyacid dehydrogenase, partial [Pseudomonadales bacterium]
NYTMAIFFHWDAASLDVWKNAFSDFNLDPDIRTHDSLGDVTDIKYAIVWAPPEGLLKTFLNLEYIFSIGAGVTHITLDPDAPTDIPIVRLQDQQLVLDMSCHIIYMVLHFHRHYARYKRYQSEKKWQRDKYPENANRRVAVMGLGQTGLDVCARLRDLDFNVIGWSNSPKEIDGVSCLHGPEQFEGLLTKADILINLLPLTPLTENIMNEAAFAQMPPGAYFINCSRGGTVVDNELIAALDSGQLEAAALDVFRTEPLSPESPYWEHPAVTITPHAAAPSNERSAASFIAGNIRKHLDGGVPSPIVSPTKGY